MKRIISHDISNSPPPAHDMEAMAHDIKRWARELGFQQAGISDIDLGQHPQHLARWLAAGHHADMAWMAEPKRCHPDQLVPGTQRIISVRMDYLPADPRCFEVLNNPDLAYVSRYALGRDYHKLIRRRLQQLADKISQAAGPFGYRAFVDSAPVLEKAVASQAGLGWIGKHTVVINRQAGSWFFLGELFTDLPLPIDAPVSSHCGSCQACIDICPTKAIVAPFQLDAGKCISYLTIEHRGSIPAELRRPIGNRIFGCDDCQMVCPWNRYAKPSQEKDFLPRHDLDQPEALALLAWTEAEWSSRTEGMALRRAGYRGWLRNVSIALGNAPGREQIAQALAEKQSTFSDDDMLSEHLAWALAEQQSKITRR